MNFFKSSLNFTDLNLFKLNNYSKFFFLKTLKHCAYNNTFGNFFFMNFLNLYSKFDFCNVFLDNRSVNFNNTMLRFNVLFSTLGANFVKYEFFSNKNFILTYNKIKTDKFSKSLIIITFKFIVRYYLNFIFLLIFNYSNFFFKLIFLTFKKNILLLFNVDGKAVS